MVGRIVPYRIRVADVGELALKLNIPRSATEKVIVETGFFDRRKLAGVFTEDRLFPRQEVLSGWLKRWILDVGLSC